MAASAWMSRWLTVLVCAAWTLGAHAAPAAPHAQGVAAAAPHADATGLAPHRAAYELSRGTGSRDAQIAGVRGRMEVTFESSCDGWRLEQSLGLRLFTDRGLAADSLAVLTAWETSDGRDYWFNTLGYEDGALAEVIRGVARAESPERAVRLTLGEPVTESRALPEGTLFPVAHLQALLAAARDGKRSLVRMVFDGSTMQSPYEISAFFGAERESHPRLGDAGGRAWPVRLAYYRPDAVSPDPEFEMSLLLHENGVAGDMVYDYGDLEIAVTLRDVEMLAPATSCER